MQNANAYFNKLMKFLTIKILIKINGAHFYD